MENINVLSLVIGTLIPTLVGFIYYSKPVAGKAWMEAIGMTEEKMQNANMVVLMGVSLLMSFALTFFMVNFCNGHEGEFDSFKHGAAHGLVLTLFVIAPVLITKGLYEQATWKGMLIAVVYWGITMSLIGGTVDAMNHFPV